MCGIVAISSPVGGSFPLEKPFRAIAHRGPDDQGIFVSETGDCHLGHVRLSIIDLSQAGHQPMSDCSGRYIISYNGEVYNFQELRRALERVHGQMQWRSTSDTEVIIEGFAREGVSFLSKLNGIFALAVYDKQDGLLHVLRDPLGIKPLFFTEQNGTVFFCSELKGLLALPGMNRTLRFQSLADELAFMYIPEPHTRFKEIEKMEPGICLSYREGRRIASVNLFEHLQDPISFSSDKEMIVAFYGAFCSAVKRQLVSDVPVSLMLSGGVDSSAVAHEVKEAGADVRDAYTISFSTEDRKYDQQSDDLHFARIIATKLGLRLQVIEANADFASLLPQLAPFLEDGISDPAAINTYLICRSARDQGVKVMLTGQGADEFLGGYRRYLAERMIGWVPRPLRSAAKFVSHFFPEHMPGRLNAVNRRAKRILALAGHEGRERLLRMYIWNDPQRIISLFREKDGIEIGRIFGNLLERYENMPVIEAMMRMDHQFDLMSLNLAYTDRMSMAVGVEARVPFLDFELVRVMNSIPADVKLKGSVLKFVLKKAMEPYLPHEIVHREKAGFGLPIRAWMRQNNEMLKHYFDRAHIKQQGIFDPGALEEMCEEQFSGKRDHANTLFSMLCIQIWLESNS
jgi:asparagine synthase (glutamine-hydrolysing)